MAHWEGLKTTAAVLASQATDLLNILHGRRSSDVSQFRHPHISSQNLLNF